MNIDTRKRQEEKFLKDLYPIADYNIRQKTNTELEIRNFKLHFYLLRFAFAILSFSLYIPTLIELFQTSYTISDHIRNFIIILVLAMLEVGLSTSLYDYYVRYYSENSNKSKTLIYLLAGASIILSAFSGANAIQILDKSEHNIRVETTKERDNEVNKYLKIIDINQSKIEKLNSNIGKYTYIINNNKSIAATKKGAAQIAKAQKAIDNTQKNIAKIETQNNKLLNLVSKIRKETRQDMTKRLTKAGKKELIYMIIFFISGIVAVVGLMFSYNFIGKYYSYVRHEAQEIEYLKDMLKDAETESEKMLLKHRISNIQDDLQERGYSESDIEEINNRTAQKKKYKLITTEPKR